MLNAKFVMEQELAVLAVGEMRRMDVKLENTGNVPIGEVWMVGSDQGNVWVDVLGEVEVCEFCPFHSCREHTRSLSLL